MALWVLKNRNKYGNLKTRIIYKKDDSPFIVKKGLGNLVIIGRFKYDYKHSYISPSLYTNLKGEKYIVPSYQRVNIGTELKDINWIRPVFKEAKSKLKSWNFKSSSSDIIYKVSEGLNRKGEKTLRCDCPGFLRVRNRALGCKHIQEVNKKS